MLRSICVLTICFILLPAAQAVEEKQAAAPPPAAIQNPVPAAPDASTADPPPGDRLLEDPKISKWIEEHINRATQLYVDRKFLEAAEELQKAYDLKHDPIILFNIGQAYRRGSRPKKAVEMYRAFVAAAPDHRYADEARGYIASLSALCEEQDELSKVLSRLQAERETAEKALKAEQQRTLQVSKQLEEERQRQAHRPFYKRAWFWGVVGGVVGAGVVLGATLGTQLANAPHYDGGVVKLMF